MANLRQPTATATEVSASQFTLRSLLLLSAAAAILITIDASARRGWRIVLVGVFLALASYLGILSVVQRPRIARVVLYLAWAVFAASMFMPVEPLSLSGSSFASGWEELQGMAAVIPNVWLLTALPLLRMAFCITLAANVAMAALPLLANRIVAGKSSWYVYVLILAAVISWLPLAVVHRLYLGYGYGYFFWTGAMTAPVVAVRISLGQLIALFAALATGVAIVLSMNSP